MTFPRTRFLQLAFAAATTCLATVTQAQTKGLKLGDKAPTAVVQSLDGKPVDFAKFVEGPLLIEFWAT